MKLLQPAPLGIFPACRGDQRGGGGPLGGQEKEAPMRGKRRSRGSYKREAKAGDPQGAQPPHLLLLHALLCALWRKLLRKPSLRDWTMRCEP